MDAYASDDVAEASIAVIGANTEMLRSTGLTGDPVEDAADAPAMTLADATADDAARAIDVARAVIATVEERLVV